MKRRAAPASASARRPSTAAATAAGSAAGAATAASATGERCRSAGELVVQRAARRSQATAAVEAREVAGRRRVGAASSASRAVVRYSTSSTPRLDARCRRPAPAGRRRRGRCARARCARARVGQEAERARPVDHHRPLGEAADRGVLLSRELCAACWRNDDSSTGRVVRVALRQQLQPQRDVAVRHHLARVDRQRRVAELDVAAEQRGRQLADHVQHVAEHEVAQLAAVDDARGAGDRARCADRPAAGAVLVDQPPPRGRQHDPRVGLERPTNCLDRLRREQVVLQQVLDVAAAAPARTAGSRC